MLYKNSNEPNQSVGVCAAVDIRTRLEKYFTGCKNKSIQLSIFYLTSIVQNVNGRLRYHFNILLTYTLGLFGGIQLCYSQIGFQY